MLNKLAEDSTFKKLLKYLQDALTIQHYVNTDNQAELAKYVLKDRPPEELEEIDRVFKNVDQDKAASIIQYPFHVSNTVHSTGEWLINLLRYGSSRAIAPVYGIKGLFTGDGYLEGQHKYLTESDRHWQTIRDDWQAWRQDVEDYAQSIVPFKSKEAELSTKALSIVPELFIPAGLPSKLSKANKVRLAMAATPVVLSEVSHGSYSIGKGTGAEEQLGKDQDTFNEEVVPAVQQVVSERDAAVATVQQLEAYKRQQEYKNKYNDKVIERLSTELSDLKNSHRIAAQTNLDLQAKNSSLASDKEKLDQLNKEVEKRLSQLTGGSVGALTGIPAGLLVNKLLGNKSTKSKIISSLLGSGVLGLAGAYAGKKYYENKLKA